MINADITLPCIWFPEKRLLMQTKKTVHSTDGRKYSMNKGSNELIRNMNTALILQTIVQEKLISRATLAKKLKLSKATVSTIVEQLISQKLIREKGKSDSDTSGRKPVLLEFCPESGYVLSLDVRLHSIPSMITDLTGSPCKALTIPSHADETQIIPLLISLIEKMLSLVPPSPHGVIGISLAIHGVVDNGVVLFTPYYPYRNIDFIRELEQHFQIPVYVENEANLAVLGEHALAPGYQNLASLSIHSGVGLGLLINNQLYKGAKGYAGEFGHTTIEIGGRPCPCGNRGCLEQYLSEEVLLKEYAEQKQLGEINLSTLLQAYHNNDTDAEKIIRKFLKYTAVGIHNIQRFADPEIIILNSRITAALPETREQLLDLLPGGAGGRCPVLYSSLGDRAALLGGTVLCMKEFAGIDILFHA